MAESILFTYEFMHTAPKDGSNIAARLDVDDLNEEIYVRLYGPNRTTYTYHYIKWADGFGWVSSFYTTLSNGHRIPIVVHPSNWRKRKVLL